MKTITALVTATALSLGSVAVAQVLPTLPRVGTSLPSLGDALNPVTQTVDRATQTLAQARLDRIADLVRAHPDRIALDPSGAPARAGELIVTDASDDVIAAAVKIRLTVIERGETLGVGYVRFALPVGMTLKTGITLLRRIGARDVTADQLYTASGVATDAAAPTAGHGVRIGMIDSGVAGTTATQRGFAAGAPRASDHGTAIASLIAGSGQIRGAAPGAAIFAADIYGDDPAGGNASAMAKALGWLVGERVPVVTISLVGPANPLLGRVIAAAQARGALIVAAVGNDGPASPPSYPASYPGVIAVTAIDRRKRVLIEAGRATHLDYSAPGADMLAATAKGSAAPVRGTSFAAPLVAAIIAQSYPMPDPAKRAAALAAVDVKAEHRDRRYGRGILCGACTTPQK